MKPIPYHIGRPPKALRKAKLDNIALVPASLLFQKGKYQTIANNLPGRGVLICQAEKQDRISTILEHVASFFRQRGHFVRTLPSSMLLKMSAYFSTLPQARKSEASITQ